MAKYISVLNSDLNKPFHVAIQWDTSIASLRANKYYSAGVNMNIPKNASDANRGVKQVTEVSTQLNGTATMFELSTTTVQAVKFAINKASKKSIAALTEKE